jgi:hypothetical protein
MQAASWISLLRRIPANLHDGLNLLLTTGAEVVVQQFVKLDAECLILRGRMAGTQDTGRVVMLPYCNLVAVNITRRLAEPEIEAIFGKDGQPFPAPIALSISSPAEQGDSSPAATPERPADDGSPVAKPAMPSKSVLIAKLRARLAETNKSGGSISQ